MNCFLCGEYDATEEAHLESNTHLHNYLNYLLSQRENKINLKTEEQINLEKELGKIRQRFEDMVENKEFDCGNLESGTCEESFETLEEALEHEKTCMKFKRDVIIVKPEKKLYSNDKATCENCGKIYLHNTKLHPKYALARHKKTCSHDKSKQCRTNIRNFLNNATEEQLLKMNAFISQFT